MITGYISSIQEPSRNETKIISTTSVELSPARQMIEQRRKDLIIRNISTIAINDVITITMGNQTASNNAGIILKPGDTLSYSESSPESPIFQGVINAICSQASAIANLSIFER